MDPIQMVDLKGQYLNIKEEIDTAIQQVIDSSAFINGPQVRELKSELSKYQSCKHTIPCANGTDALQIALMALDLQPGDEVIVPDFTFIATAEVIALLKLKPVFVDVDRDTFLLDLQKVRESVTNKTKAIIPVHLYGQCVDMHELMNLATERNIYVIEDNAQAFGADILFNGEWKKSGTVGHIGCTSFFPSKNLGCYGDGGAIFTNDNKLGEKLASIANHGAKVKYYHDDIGVNSRLDTIQAAILKVKLNKIDEYNQARQKAAQVYDEVLAECKSIIIPRRVEFSTHVFHQYTLKVQERDKLKDYLNEKSIPAMIYYPVGMHNQHAYKTSGEFQNSDYLCNAVISLPMHTELTFEQQLYIANTVKEFYKK
ncbi:MAG: DegT/DnrJ/EryC1/StrS family aminotransferase [Bacteroidales bacterium]|nr:DegT/DnrJ/EryC1/StrS family aminotransferase [Bacteroidales bacterium]MBN2820619.1 DegT/DnrJ/EryC1/StrS family aminotransferase [Bacteroidales bacterium]